MIFCSVIVKLKLDINGTLHLLSSESIHGRSRCTDNNLEVIKTPLKNLDSPVYYIGRGKKKKQKCMKFELFAQLIYHLLELML